MRIEIYIRGEFMADVELTPPGDDEYLEYKDNYEIRKRYIDSMIKSLKNKYQKLIESNTWEIYMVADSKVCDWINMEEELELFEQNINE